MDDNKDDGSKIFDKIFSGFFGSGFDDHFQEMTRQMEEMFRQFGDSTISVEFRPPNMSGNQPPSYNDSPRDQMLKDPGIESKGQKPTQTSGDMEGEITLSNPRREVFIPMRFPSLFGSHPGFGRPSNDDESGKPSPECGCGENDQLSWQPHGSSASSSSWNKTITSFSNNGSGWTGEEVRTTRLPDGSVEKVVKKTENGRTCTTVTTTDPSGHSTSSTTCDRPAIERAPSKHDNPSTGSWMTSLWPWSTPTRSRTPATTEYSQDDISFFKKYFGFDIHKPKD